jgi:tRNA(Ile)-lysidine synthase
LFVKALSEQQQVKFFHTQFDTEAFAREHHVSIQMAARELRYKWLDEVRKKEQYHFIATAHHRDDNIETVLLIFSGEQVFMACMVFLQHKVRSFDPCYHFTKANCWIMLTYTIFPFGRTSQMPRWEYDRNKIRLEIIPHIERYYPAFRSTFTENIRKWKDAGLLYDKEIAQLRRKLLEKKGDDISYPSTGSYNSLRRKLSFMKCSLHWDLLQNR